MFVVLDALSYNYLQFSGMPLKEKHIFFQNFLFYP